MAAALAQAVPAGHFDELRGLQPGPDGLDPLWAQFFEHMGSEGFADLNRRQHSLAQQLRDNGVSYNVHADEHNPQRPWALDLFPLLVSPQDWSQIETGVLQRTRLLNLVMADLYGARELLRRGLLPPALALGHPDYLRAMQGVEALGQTWLHITAFDLARGPDGRWWVLSQRTQAPPGLGYLLENRIAIARQFPQAFASMRVQRLAASYKALMQGLQTLSPRGTEARMALLTGGPHTRSYFEHTYLARYLGLNLVEGNDLTVREQRLYLKTIEGLEPIDVLIKTLDDQWLDPLELRPDSNLGVPGLMQALRAGHLLLANAPGSAPLESSALLGYLPAISEHLLGQPLALPSLPTWWCGEAEHRHSALQGLRQGVLKSTFNPHGAGHEAVFGPTLTPSGLDQLAGRIVRRPDEHTLQSHLPLSQHPIWHGKQIMHRPALLRVFALADGARSWRVLPGGLVRLGPRWQAMAPMQRGSSSADCWVLTQGEVDQTSLLQSAPSTLSLALQKRLITSRSAENLFWLGRHTERADNAVRLASLTLRCLQSEEQIRPQLLAWLSVCAKFNGLVLPAVPNAQQSARVFARAVIAMLGADSGAHSVGYTLRALRNTASHVRERLAQEQRNLIERVETGFSQAHQRLACEADSASPAALEALQHASELLSAITGAQTDRMVRDDGWRMLSIGRHIERLSTLAHALGSAIDTDSIADDQGFEAVLALFDSTITFHAQYQQRRDWVALLHMLVTHGDNPRSLAWVLSTLRSRLSKLPESNGQRASQLLRELPDPSGWDLIALSAAAPGACSQSMPGLRPGFVPHDAATASSQPALRQLLQSCESQALAVSDRLGDWYFSHTDSSSQSLML
ncbi:circularly permuted type 2 ATP-grasp protein [Serpentinimonas barnesii]|uniref:circularly permuted type 2 ATP-grasp protein n=1 Tax=Serpentinimonas barnesii TaxID=1458427 RepID=UPI0005EF88F1|nr:circularly permuted type 2 ATP-grasp protein [Serpentinimonas barnesii]